MNNAPLSRLDVARLRHARHYERVLRRADAEYLAGASASDAGLRSFDAEWPNIVQGQRAAAEMTTSYRDAARCCSDYGNAGAGIFAFRVHPQDLVAWMEPAVAAAVSLSDPLSQAAHLHNLAYARFTLGQTPAALDLYSASLELHRSQHNLSGEADARAGRANALLRLGQIYEAEREHQERLAAARAIGDMRGEAKALGSLATMAHLRGDFRAALEYHEHSMALDRDARQPARRRSQSHGHGRRVFCAW